MTNVSIIFSIRQLHQFARFTLSILSMRIIIGQGINRKKTINQDMTIGIAQSSAMITDRRIVGMTIGEMIINAVNIGVMTDIMDIVRKMTDKITINAIIETIMNEITQPDGIIIGNLIGVVDIKIVEAPIITKVITTIDNQIVDSMITESRTDLDISNMILEMEITSNLKMVTDLSMKTVNQVAQRCQLAIFAGKMATMLTNAQQKKKAKHWQLI